MVAYLTIEKISEKFRGREIPEKIDLNKTYTTIGDMPHHDVRLPFSGSKAAYLSIHQDEDGNYFLTPYDIKIFINNNKLTESICLRDKDLIQITEDYTYTFNYIKPIVTKTAEPPSKEIVPAIVPLKPSKSGILKKTTRLEKMDRKTAEQTLILSAEILPDQAQREPIDSEIQETNKENQDNTLPSVNIEGEKTEEKTLETQENQIAKEIQEPAKENAQQDTSSDSKNMVSEEKIEPPVESESNHLQELNELQTDSESHSLDESLEAAESSSQESPSIQEKKVDLSLREKRITSAFKKQKLTLRHTSDLPKENIEQELHQEISQQNPIEDLKQNLIETEEGKKLNSTLSNETPKSIGDNEDAITPISTEKKPENRDTNEAPSQQATDAELSPNTPKDLINTWKQALHCIMDQAQQAEKMEFTPEDSKNLITNWKETLETLMQQAEKNILPIVDQAATVPKDTKKASQKITLQADSIGEEDSSLIAEEASREYLTSEEIEEEEIQEWDKPSSTYPPIEKQEEKIAEYKTSWRETLQNLVEKSSKEKNSISDSKISGIKIPQLKPPVRQEEKLTKGRSALSDSKILDEKNAQEKSSSSDSKKLRSLKKSSLDAAKKNTLDTLRESEASLDYASEPEMTLMWDSNMPVEHPVQVSPRLISPSSGEVLALEKEIIYIGRSVSCDMCIVDDYISRQHLELKRIPLGFILKNIGKNDVFIEKRSSQSISFEGKIALEQKILKPGESTLLLQEAIIIIGSQILYYFSGTDDKEINSESQVRERKFDFYKNLANHKKELLDAAQLQKTLIPPKVIFEDLQIGVWFKYMAINDLSGDFFLYHREGNSLYFCLGDVSGHGAAAALMASQISGMFRILAERQENVEGIAQSINTNLFKAKRRTHNLYALVDILKVTSNGIELCIAGNSVPPLYYNAKDNELISLDTPSTPTGLFTSGHFKTYIDVLKFEKNDMLIMFTDGVTEAEMVDGALLEYDRTQEFIQYQIQQNQPWEFFLDNFLVWLKQHCEIRDDLSIVLIGKF